MKKRGHNTAFYIETLLLITVFIGIILILTQIFAVSRKKSAEARNLTTAVLLAENAAEAFYAAESPEQFPEILFDDKKIAEEATGELAQSVIFLYNKNMEPDPEGAFSVVIEWTSPEDGFTRGSVRVSENGTELYELPLSSAGKEDFR